MQSDYVSAFGLGALMGAPNNNNNNNKLITSRRSIRAIDDDDDDNEFQMNIVSTSPSQPQPTNSVNNMTPAKTSIHRTTPQQQQQQFYSKSSTMLANGQITSPATTTTTSVTNTKSNLKRNRFNSVETTPTTTNTSSSSTDTVTPLHNMASKAAAAVMRRSHSIKLAAQAKRKSAIRSLSHTYAPSASDDHYELDHINIGYESFRNREEEDSNENDDADNEEDDDRDADVEDVDEDDADENESLLHHGPAAAAAAAATSACATQSATSVSNHYHDHHHHRDFNNNTAGGGLNTSDNSGGGGGGVLPGGCDDPSGLKVIIVNNSSVALTPIATAAKSKRVDSIRMRHHSNLGASSSGVNGNQDAVSSSSSSSRLKKYFKCRKNKVRSKASQRRHNYLVIFLLFVVNLLNYIDRYTLAGVLLKVQDYFDINDSQSGLLQTVFICSYMLLAPLFGYLGDRYSRKWIIIFGISFWSLMTFLGSLVGRDQFWLFALIRSLVGIGEASYSCVAPTIIGDLFTNEMRTKMLAVFYLAVPVGSGMGYIVGSNVADLTNDWKWALRVTPPLGFICVLLLVFVVQEPKRGSAEGSAGSAEFDSGAARSNIKQDVVYLLKNKTFMWITFGFTFASFVLGGLSWWVPAYVQYAIYSNNKIPDQIPLKFGVVTCISGLFGVALSSVLAEKLRKKTPNADPLVCALGSLIAVPSLFVLILATGAVNEALFWLIAAVAISAMCLSWTIVADVLLYAIYPNRRSIASALNILICHLFGDAGSPYVIGAISDAFRRGKPDTYNSKFTSLQVALYAGPFFAALSFAAYLFAAIYVVEDKKEVDDYLRRAKQMSEAINGSGEEGNDKHFTSSNESTLNETSMAKAKKQQHSSSKHHHHHHHQPTVTHNVEENAYVNPIALTQEMGTQNELSSPQASQLPPAQPQ